MTNTYFKLQNSKLKQDSIKSFANEYDRQYRESFNSNSNEDLYSLVNGMHKYKLNDANLDINTLLKYYTINKLIDSPEKEVNKLSNNLNSTANLNIKKDNEGNYYRIINGNADLDNNIVSVYDDGSYSIQEHRQYCPFKIVRTYNLENQPIIIQVRNLKGDIMTDKWQIAEFLNLRQEFKTKYKYSGYSGNSKEILAKVLNKFSKPMPTGYYMDSKCLIWKWNYSNSCFYRIFEREYEMPLMSDLEFSDGIVIRQEYTGIAS